MGLEVGNDLVGMKSNKRRNWARIQDVLPGLSLEYGGRAV